jgi:hypothetical protein
MPLIVCLSISLISLGVLDFIVKQKDYRNLLLSVPKNIGASRIDIHKIEDFCEEKFLLTYEIIEADKAVLSYSAYPVILVSTNSVYPHILGFSMIEGAFFSKQSWDRKQKHLTLNEQAAFTIFGTSRVVGNRLKIQNEIWIVTGVIQDDDEACRIYLPSSVRGNPADFIMALMDPGKGIHEVYAKNSLKTLGVQDNSFNFFNLETNTRLFMERIQTALLFVGCILIVISLNMTTDKIKHIFSALQTDLNNRYLRELFIVQRTVLLKLLFLAIILSISLGSALFLILRIISICLHWRDIASLRILTQEVFYTKIALLKNLELPDQLLFGAYLICLIFIFIYRFIKYKRKI